MWRRKDDGDALIFTNRRTEYLKKCVVFTLFLKIPFRSEWSFGWFCRLYFQAHAASKEYSDKRLFVNNHKEGKPTNRELRDVRRHREICEGRWDVDVRRRVSCDWECLHADRRHTCILAKPGLLWNGESAQRGKPKSNKGGEASAEIDVEHASVEIISFVLREQRTFIIVAERTELAVFFLCAWKMLELLNPNCKKVD